MAASAGTAASTRGSVRCSAPAHIYTTAAHLWATPLPRQRRADQRCRQASLDRAGGGTPSRPQTNLGAAARDPSSIPDDLIQELGQLPGVRIVLPPPQGSPARLTSDAAGSAGHVTGSDYEADDFDDEDWDEVMAELQNPWEFREADTDDLAMQGPGTVPDTPTNTSAAQITQPPVLVSEVQDVSDVTELRAVIASHTNITVLDVRSDEEASQRPVPGALRCTIQGLTGDTARQLSQQTVLVLGTGDYRGSQACVRLTRVYGALNVYYYEPGAETWPADLVIKPAGR